MKPTKWTQGLWALSSRDGLEFVLQPHGTSVGVPLERKDLGRIIDARERMFETGTCNPFADVGLEALHQLGGTRAMWLVCARAWADTAVVEMHQRVAEAGEEG